jgi:hypothetical protein
MVIYRHVSRRRNRRSQNLPRYVAGQSSQTPKRESGCGAVPSKNFLRRSPYVTRFDGDIATYELCVDHANSKLEALGEVNIERAVLRKELWNQLTTLTNAEKQLETGVGSINSPNLPSEEKVWELRKKFDETRAKPADL